MSDNYICIDDMSYINVKDEMPSYTLEEIKKQKNTELLVSQCEKLIEEMQAYLDRNGFSYKKITISSYIGILVEKDHAKEADGRVHKVLQGLLEISDEDKRGLNYATCMDLTYHDIKDHMVKDIVPLSFSVDYRYTGDESNYNEIDNTVNWNPEKYEKKFRKSVCGFVNFEEFIKTLREKGYRVYINEYDACNSFDDCISAIYQSSLAGVCIEKKFEKEIEPDSKTYEKAIKRNNILE